MKLTHSTWMTHKESSKLIGYVCADTLRKKVRTGKLFADRSFGKNATMFLRKDILEIAEQRKKILYKRPIVIREKNVCCCCEKTFAGRKLTQFKKQKWCGPCLNKDEVTPTLETYATMQSNMASIVARDEKTLHNMRWKAYYNKKKLISQQREVKA